MQIKPNKINVLNLLIRNFDVKSISWNNDYSLSLLLQRYDGKIDEYKIEFNYFDLRPKVNFLSGDIYSRDNKATDIKRELNDYRNNLEFLEDNSNLNEIYKYLKSFLEVDDDLSSFLKKYGVYLHTVLPVFELNRCDWKKEDGKYKSKHYTAEFFGQTVELRDCNGNYISTIELSD
ncbi:hypothetical protein [Lactobacillus mulieris]|uniref:Uncharacterized protein n=1 Tax=Lactobacillus mulieris TaxID=2508708 RepID=A0AAP3GV78_9LACO|nr:hypothetical protein [Lactobacillus mulieris]MCZ3844135.1 hypothetical protein [Lactobacillus mulieris]MCZ3875795.1 hypothetical protein [Lactobacillus mulieris]WEB30169.1 hypothetical protein PUW59_05305 [Lactobacillus mulieris]